MKLDSFAELRLLSEKQLVEIEQVSGIKLLPIDKAIKQLEDAAKIYSILVDEKKNG